MSHPTALLKSPNLIIKGRHYEVINYPDPKTPFEQDNNYHCIELDFTILVNGKMANFTNSFTLERPYSEDNSSSEWVLSNYGEWYLVVRMFMALGYFISEDIRDSERIGETQMIIKKWLRDIMHEDNTDISTTTQSTWVSGVTDAGYVSPPTFTTGSGTESMKTAIN